MTGDHDMPADAASRCPRLSLWAMAAVLVLLVAIVYANTLQSPFIFDDIPNIRENPFVRPSGFSLEAIADAGLRSPSSRRPVAYVSFALNYLCHGDAVAGYHLVNIAVHAAAAVLVFLLLRVTLQAADPQQDLGDGGFIAFWTAALWAVHPLNTQSVTYIVQRMNALAAMFFLFSLLGYAYGRLSPSRRRRWGWFAGSAVTGLMAAGSKEIAATQPVFIFLYEWYFFQHSSGAWLRRRIPLMLLIAVAGVLAGWFVLGTDPAARILADYTHRDFTPGERVLTQFRVVVFYLSQLAFPHPSRLNLDHQFTVSHSLTDPASTLAAACLLLAAAAWAVARARRHPLTSFFIVWFLGNLVIESSVIGLEMVFEHRTYLPGIGVVAMAVLAIFRWVRRPVLRTLVLAALVLVLGSWTVTRNAVWQDDLSLWGDSAAKSPDKPRPQNKYGVALEKRGRLNAARAQFLKVIALDRNHPYAWCNLGNIHLRQGRYAEAEACYRRQLALVPRHAEAGNNLGVVLAATGRTDEAMAQFREILRRRPGAGDAHRNLAGLLLGAGDIDGAAAHLRRALAADPDDAEARYLMGNAYLARDRLDEALSWYEDTLKRRPGHVDARLNAGLVMARTGRLAEAVSYFEAALRHAPDDERVRSNLRRAVSELEASDR